MPLDLIDVALFVRTCSTLNLSAAGREFGLSPAATSARLAQLEHQLGSRLLHRTTRQITLTMEGEIFLAQAKRLLEAADMASASVGRARTNPEGLLRVAAPASFGRLHILPFIEPFLRDYPNIQLDLRLSDTVIDLASHAIDVAIRIGNLKDSALIAKKIAPNRLVVCASPNYLEKHGMPQHPSELTQHECIALHGRHNWKFLPNAKTKNPEPISIRVKGRLTSDNGEVLREAALSSLGIAMHSTWAVTEDLKSGKLVQILRDWPIAENMSIWAIYINRNFIPPKTQAFIDYFAQRFGEEPYWDK